MSSGAVEPPILPVPPSTPHCSGPSAARIRPIGSWFCHGPRDCPGKSSMPAAGLGNGRTFCTPPGWTSKAWTWYRSSSKRPSGIYPEAQFSVGSLERLPTADESLAGILAWYSLIHTPPAGIAGFWTSLPAASIPAGASCSVSSMARPCESFPHAVTPAYFWPVEEMSARLQEAGFSIVSTHSRADPGARPHAAIVAQRLLTPGRVG